MSERSIYLRDQATKCRGHADSMTDLETQAALRRLAAGYVAQAEAIEESEKVRPPQLASVIFPLPSQALHLTG
jgi:hypothetical protein